MPFPLCKIPKIRLDFFLDPPPLMGNFPKLYLVINHDGFPTGFDGQPYHTECVARQEDHFKAQQKQKLVSNQTISVYFLTKASISWTGVDMQFPYLYSFGILHIRLSCNCSLANIFLGVSFLEGEFVIVLTILIVILLWDRLKL